MRGLNASTEHNLLIAAYCTCTQAVVMHLQGPINMGGTENVWGVAAWCRHVLHMWSATRAKMYFGMGTEVLH